MPPKRKYRRDPGDDLIRIGFVNKDGTRGVTKKIPRRRMTKETVDTVFQTKVQYLSDNTADVLWPEDWIMRTIEEPHFYRIHTKYEWEKEKDAILDMTYEGETQVIIINVDQIVGELDLKAFLKSGLIQSDEKIIKAKKNLEIASKKVAKLDEKLAKLPFMQTDATKPKEAALERKMMKDFLEKEKNKILLFVDKAQKDLRSAESMFAAVPISLWKVSDQESKKTSTWYCNFPDEDLGVRWATQCIRRDNWDEFRLALGNEKKKIPPYACQGDLPLDKLPFEVNMKDVAIVRRQHGEGTLNLPRQETYSGKWHEGKKEGEGFSHTPLGKFEGKFVQNHRKEKGMMRYGNGDKWEGNFDVNIVHEFKNGETTESGKIMSLLQGDRYHYGLEQRKGKYFFGDGAIYDGEMKDGKITGSGIYTSALGEVWEGDFFQGKLHGNGSFTDFDGCIHKGIWRKGEMEGEGESKDTENRHYKGLWHRGFMDGFGTYTFENGDHHVGFYKDNYRHGRGSMHFGNMEGVFDHSRGKMEYFYDNIYEGTFNLGNIASDCTCYDTEGEYWRFTTNGKSTHYERLSTLPEIENLRTETAEIERIKRIEAENLRLQKIHRKNLNRYKARWKDEQVIMKALYQERLEAERARVRVEQARIFKAKLEKEKQKRSNRLHNYIQQAKGEETWMNES